MTTQRPLVSLGIPTYNSEGVIRDALDALLAQTYDNLRTGYLGQWIDRSHWRDLSGVCD